MFEATEDKPEVKRSSIARTHARLLLSVLIMPGRTGTAYVGYEHNHRVVHTFFSIAKFLDLENLDFLELFYGIFQVLNSSKPIYIGTVFEL